MPHRLRGLAVTLLRLVAALLAGATALSAQVAGLAAGSVFDAATGRPLDRAVVSVLAASPPRWVRTGATGAFALAVAADSARLVAAAIGYAPETVAVAPRHPVTFRLRPAVLALDPVVVSAERAAATSTADARLIGDLDIRLRSRESSQELLRLAPGLFIAQHAGGGKAEQIFLRGFDADHGSDVAISVDGVPTNLVSHAHGQGYADLHWLIPEIVDYIDVHKGPYEVADGDLATAGAVALHTKDRLPEAAATTRGGSFGTVHALALLPLGGDAAAPGGYVALAGHYTNGPFDNPQHYARYNGYGKWTAPAGAGALVVATAAAYDARWNASGQIPERAVARGLIDRFGSIDPSEGGNTARYAVTLGLRSATRGASAWDAMAYASRARLQLYSDFTFLAQDPINGDAIEQDDQRDVVGVAATRTRGTTIFGLPGVTGIGVGGRADFIELGLFHDRQRVRLATRVSDAISEQSSWAWVRQAVELSGRVRLQLGVRGDLFRFSVRSRLGAVPPDSASASGVRWQGLVSPKANLAVELSDATALFANVGYGFHSNDARDVVAAPRDAVVTPRALGAELGVRRYWAGGSLGAALWATDLESELVYNGDLGTTEPSGRTRRYGFDWEARVRLVPWLWVDADLNLAHGRFRDAPPQRDRIPLAPAFTSTGGLTVRDAGPVGGGLRYRHMAARPADAADSIVARGYTVLECFGTWRIARLELLLTLDNLLNAHWNEAQFATTSRLAGEPAPVTDLNFTPGAPRTLQLGLDYRF